MNTHLSISAADSYGQNSAIFAPGWLVEKQNYDKSGQFWSLIYKALKPDGNSCTDDNICQAINTELTLDGNDVEFEIINGRLVNDSKIEFEERFQINTPDQDQSSKLTFILIVLDRPGWTLGQPTNSF